jgi:hypothetical protein
LAMHPELIKKIRQTVFLDILLTFHEIFINFDFRYSVVIVKRPHKK